MSDSRFFFYKLRLALLVSSISVVSTVFVYGQAPDLAWTKALGQNGLTTTSSFFRDETGNSYLLGIYTSTLTLGSATLPFSGASSNQFIAKFDPSGNALWAKRMTGISAHAQAVNPDKITVDRQGNVYMAVVAYTGTTINGVSYEPLSGMSDYCLIKLDASGNVLWVRMCDLPQNVMQSCNALFINLQNQVCMAGLFQSTISFGNSQSLTNPTSTGMDAFVVCYDTEGAAIKATRLGVVNNVSTFDTDEIFRYNGNGFLYRLSCTAKTIVTYNEEGTMLLTKTFTTGGAAVRFTCLEADREGSIFVGGWLYGGAVTIEGTAVAKYGPSTSTDAFILKLTKTGTAQWVRTYQYHASDAYHSLRCDDLGNLYGLGQHSDLGTMRSLLIKYTPDGTVLWEQVIDPGPVPMGANPGWAEAMSMALAPNGGNIVVAGRFKERIRFNNTISYTTAAGDAKIFIAQYGICASSPINITSTASQFCEGDSILISASPAGTYVWSTNDTAAAIYVHNTGNYYAIAPASNECYERSASIYLAALALPQTGIVLENSSLKAVEENASYLWLEAGNDYAPIAGATSQVFLPEREGLYAVCVTNSNGCADTSDAYSYTTTDLRSMKETATASLYPNPASDIVQLESDAAFKTIRILGATGQELLRSSMRHIDVSSLPVGIYFVIAETEKENWMGKFVKQ